MRAGIVRAEGNVVTSASSTDLVLIQHFSSISGQYEPKEITVANLFAGGPDTPNLDLGASGIPGRLRIFPGTALSGDLKIIATNNSGNYETTFTNAAMGQASTISIPDPGTATANFVLDQGNQTIAGNKTLSGSTQINTLSIGASGTIGSLSLFSGTASKGKWLFTPVDNTGNTTMTITNAAQGGAYTYTIPNAGASASFMMTQGSQTVVGNNTFTGTTQANTLNIGASGTLGNLSLFSGTASKGSWNFVPVDNTGNTVMTITNAAQGGARTYTIPDAAANASFVMQNKGASVESSNAVTINNLAGVITSSSLTTTGGSTYVITLTNSYIASTSIVMLTIAGGTNSATFNITSKVVSGSGSAVITLYNNTAATALNGTLILNFFVIP